VSCGRTCTYAVHSSQPGNRPRLYAVRPPATTVQVTVTYNDEATADDNDVRWVLSEPWDRQRRATWTAVPFAFVGSWDRGIVRPSGTALRQTTWESRSVALLDMSLPGTVVRRGIEEQWAAVTTRLSRRRVWRAD
jgi:hypothetical protein